MSDRETLADAFGRNLDPLAEYESTFEEAGVDPFALFIDEALDDDLVNDTVDSYRVTFQDWADFMDTQDRHRACPSERHVRGFIDWLREEKLNGPATIRNKLRHLGTVYTYWQSDPAFPHSEDFNPIALARDKTTLERETEKRPHRIPIRELGELVGDIRHIRDRAIVLLQLKLGLRASELANIRLEEVSLTTREVGEHYEALGTSRLLDGRPNAIYVPHDREGNKSQRPRVLPLDIETRRALIRWLLIRPDCGEPYLFLSKTRYAKLDKSSINTIWTEHFRPEYGETADHKAITSHYGRHRFTTYWRVEEDLNRELVKYLRGDVLGADGTGGNEAIDSYIHAYYEDIDSVYRERIFNLGV